MPNRFADLEPPVSPTTHTDPEAAAPPTSNTDLEGPVSPTSNADQERPPPTLAADPEEEAAACPTARDAPMAVRQAANLRSIEGSISILLGRRWLLA